MKHVALLFSAVLLLFCSCQSNHILEDIPEQENASVSSHTTKANDPYKINLQTAKYTANFLSDKLIKEIEPITHASDTIMYVVKYSDGWIVLSADKRAIPILASSPTGQFDNEINSPGSNIWFNEVANELLSLKKEKSNDVDSAEFYKNENFQFWIRMEGAATATVQHPQTRVSPPITHPDAQAYLCKRIVTNKLIDEKDHIIGSRLRTRWGQTFPWNVYVPKVLTENGYMRGYTGCTAVAMAQLLYYTHFKFNIPSGLNHGVRYDGIIIDEKNFSKTYRTGNYIENSPRWEEMALTPEQGWTIRAENEAITERELCCRINGRIRI